MKILKYLLFLLIGIILLFFVIGFVKPTINYGHEVTVNKPLKESWAVQQDESKLGLWLDGFKSIDLISGEAGKVGSKYKVVVDPSAAEDEFEMIETINAIKEFELIDLSFDSDMMLFDQTTSFSEKDGKTIIKTDSKVSGKGIMMRSLFGLMDLATGSFQAQEVKHIEALKKVIETNTKDYYPAPMSKEAEIAAPENSSQ